MDLGMVEHALGWTGNESMFIWIFMHLWNSINIWQIEIVLIWVYSKGSENRFVVVQQFWCRKICKIVYRVSGKRVKFLYQDADVVLPADKCIVVRSFVCRNKVLMETRKFSDNLRVTEMDSCLVLKERLSRRILRFRTSAIDLTHSERVSTSTSSFFAHRLAYSSHASMMILKFWCYGETGSLYVGPLLKTSLSFWLRTMLRSPVTIWPHGAYGNPESQQEQSVGFLERPSKFICSRLAL